jgi:hypothetical protein
MRAAPKIEPMTVRELRRFLEGFDPDAKVRFVAPDNEEFVVNEAYGLNGEPNIDLVEYPA